MLIRMWWTRVAQRWIVLILGLGLTGPVGCAPSPREGGFDSPHPDGKLYAMQDAVQRRDDSSDTLRRIIEQLDCDDAAVRLVAIESLRALTGQTLGYDVRDPVYIRREAVGRWVDWVAQRDGLVTVPPSEEGMIDG
jgi:hypothetical protein